jgi:hypothetical protein
MASSRSATKAVGVDGISKFDTEWVFLGRKLLAQVTGVTPD